VDYIVTIFGWSSTNQRVASNL